MYGYGVRQPTRRAGRLPAWRGESADLYIHTNRLQPNMPPHRYEENKRIDDDFTYSLNACRYDVPRLQRLMFGSSPTLK
jgi:hypothetical protein